MFCVFAASLVIFFFSPIIKLFLISSRRKIPLPPGSLGWPYIGETFQLYSQDPNVFFASKVKRYIDLASFHQTSLDPWLSGVLNLFLVFVIDIGSGQSSRPTSWAVLA